MIDANGELLRDLSTPFGCDLGRRLGLTLWLAEQFACEVSPPERDRAPLLRRVGRSELPDRAEADRD